ncbi:hypothetical protein [Pengzhenrongella phosphoraccumulans]|uniref:hypothetical protein n=1 Tax=Pengzhenrongella phosphoraccumulans TaxID=3114394 RepID=UPI00388F4494
MVNDAAGARIEPDPFPAPGVARGITIRGGVGATFVDLTELRQAAHALRLAAERLDDAAAHVARAGREVADGVADEVRTGAASLGGDLSEGVVSEALVTARATAGAALAALHPLLVGSASLSAAADRTRDLARALQGAADVYGVAEDRAQDAVRATLVAVGSAAGDAPLATGIGVLVAARFAVLAGALAAGWRTIHGQRLPNPKDLVLAVPAEAAMALLGSFVRGLAPGRQLVAPLPVPAAAGLVVAGTAVASVVVPDLRPGRLRVTARPGATRGPAPRTAGDVLRDIGALYPARGGAPGTVGVERLERPDGTRAWVVAIPGTQDATGLGWGRNPMDSGTNLALMAGARDDGTELVVRALEQAGVRPGEPVLLAGHSQGGMVAMALAGSAAFTARYSVAAVLTAGSPVAAQEVPGSIPVLHLEHRQDLVPALDGAPSPAGVNRTTAVRDLRASSDPVDLLAGHDPGAAHGVDTYARTADAVSSAGAPSVRAWEAAAGAVLGDADPSAVPAGADHSAVRLEFTGTRVELSAGRSAAGRASR